MSRNSKSVGIKVEQYSERVGRKTWLVHRRVWSLHPTKGWSCDGHRTSLSPRKVEHQQHFIRTRAERPRPLMQLSEGEMILARRRHIHPRHKRPS